MKIYCEGIEAEVVPVVIAQEARNGNLIVPKQGPPLYYVCERCGEPVPATMAAR